MASTNYLEYWYQALHSERGVIVRAEPFENLELVKQHLYIARREANDPVLQSLSIIVSPTVPGELWIIKQEQPRGEGLDL